MRFLHLDQFSALRLRHALQERIGNHGRFEFVNVNDDRLFSLLIDDGNFDHTFLDQKNKVGRIALP